MTPATAWNNLRNAAKKDPKKAGVLAVLVLVMGGLWGKLLVSSGPQQAGAATSPEAAPTGPGLTSAGASIAALPATSGKLAGNPATRAAWAAVRLAPPTRNLFAIDFTRYEQDGKPAALAGVAGQAGGDTSGEQKSVPPVVDVKKERQILVTNLQQQAAGLKLQSVMMGASPKALVNGRLVEEGDIVASFRVVNVNPRGIVVEREGIRLDVSMRQYPDAMPK